ncbi:hypothetical protein P389DRAFT_47223 [Cystobasidium minutum MCA 4210]|uniref:uncharacterized protein n=1 Tax=Cystobasidium minutum MCA 4210 TaxID=1397322 RepID=UPI0034CDE1DB|eukprot:jgi/Rhomi1/47223/CE47222_12110
MAAPRDQVPDSGEGSTGNPILDSANAMDTINRPAQSSPLASSTITAADLDTAYPASAVTSSAATTAGPAQTHDETSTAVAAQTQSGTVENVLSAIGGVVATAPLAALEAISHKVPAVVETVKAHAPQLPHGATGSSTGAGSGDSLTHKVSQSGETLVHSAQNLASQATTYAQHGIHQIVEKLPESVSSKLPAQITSIGVGGTTEKEHAATGKEAYDFTTTHTTANFEASGSLQSSKNPSIVEAQSDLAVKAESGDL